jgi:hypothetical protein
MKTPLYLALSLVLAATICLDAGPARGQSARDKATARALTHEGDEFAKKGDCKIAIEKYKQAASLYPAASILASLAECQISLGKLVEGTETAQQVAREELGPKPKQAFVNAQRRARELLQANEAKIAKLRVSVSPESPRDLRVQLDDEELRVTSLGAELRVDPGAHRVAAQAPGYVLVKQEVTLEPGASKDIVLQLEPEPSAKPKAAPVPRLAPVNVPSGNEAHANAHHQPNLPAYVSFGVGGVGLVVGTVFGLQALSTKSKLDDACNGNGDCPSRSQSDVDGLATKSLVSTIGFGTALVGAGLGTYFLLNPASDKSRQGVTARPWVGVGGAGVAGSF